MVEKEKPFVTAPNVKVSEKLHTHNNTHTTWTNMMLVFGQNLKINTPTSSLGFLKKKICFRNDESFKN